MFSKTCEYAIRAMIHIARQSKRGQKASIKGIVGAIDCPEYFIAKILQDLAKQGLVLSAKGPNGGYYMDRKSLSCSLATIVRAVDGDKIFSGCGLGLKQCSETHPCPVHDEFKKIRHKLHTMLSEARLGTFTEQLDMKKAFLKRN